MQKQVCSFSKLVFFGGHPCCNTGPRKSNSSLFLDSDLLHLLELGVNPSLVIYYKYSPKPAWLLCAPSKMTFCKFSCRSTSSSSRDPAPTETCRIPRIMSLGSIAIHLTSLCSLIFRVLPKLLGLPRSLLKKFSKDEVFGPPPIETTVCTLLELPHDILMGIFATLEIPDLVRAGSVCSSWRFAYTSLRNLGKCKQSQTPCLLYTCESAGESVACLYSLVEKRTYKLTLPEPPICSRSLIGSSQGLLITVDKRSEMHLVNPITGEQIDLPSVFTIEHLKPIYDDSGAVLKYEYSLHTRKNVHRPPLIFALGELHKLLCKAFVFSDTPKGCIVVLIHKPYRQLQFARIGDDNWTLLPPYIYYDDCVYKDGLLYAVTADGEIHGCDLSSPVVTMKMITGRPKISSYVSMYIVQAPWGNLLQVWRLVEDYQLRPKKPGAFVFWNTSKFKIYEVDVAGKKLKKICLHYHVLFLGHNQSLCLSAEEYPALKANHAYVTDDSVLWINGFKNNRRDMGILNLDNNSRDELVSPQLWSNSPAPMWITPDLRKMNLALNKEFCVFCLQMS